MTAHAKRWRSKSRAVIGGVALAAVAMVTAPPLARAEAKEVRFADQPGLPYLPMHVVISQKLVEKHAKKVGLGDIKVSAIRLSGGAAINDALISGNIEFGAAGIAPLLKLWDKTKDRIEVKAMMAMTDIPLKFITNDPRVKTIQDYVNISEHKIALPAVKTSIQAVILQMAAEKTFGPGNEAKLDNLTVSLPHPQAFAALMSGKSEVKSHGANLPFSYQLLRAKDKGLRLVFSSYDVLGPHTNIVLYNTRQWKEENPKLFKAVFDAYTEAFDWVNADLKRAAKLFKDFNKSKLELADLEAMVADKNEISFSAAPRATMKFAEFLHKTGSIKNKPAIWKDYFWDIAHHLNGS